MLTRAAPETVRLVFHRPDPAGVPALERPLQVEAVDHATGDAVLVDGIAGIARWLDAEGYAWCAGSQHVWRRA